MNDICEDDDEYLRQTYINIGMEIVSLSNGPKMIMYLVLAELISLHETRSLNNSCERTNSELFSLSSDETDDTAFKYYISSDDDTEILTELM